MSGPSQINPNSQCPERPTARELRRFNIPPLSETRLADEGQLTEQGGGYTYFWKSKPAHERRLHGVGFAMDTCSSTA